MTDRIGIWGVLIAAAMASGCGQTPHFSGMPTAPGGSAVQSPSISASGFRYGSGYVFRPVVLSGRVFEVTPNGRVPLAGAGLYCDACGEFGHTTVTTDASGFYSFPKGVHLIPGGATPITIWKDGYQDPPGVPPITMPTYDSGGVWREVMISNDDIRFDVDLVRR